ncbi:MAG TPA: hypothetical protein VJ804_06965, partial [Acidimicrobiales bacterium]|nr:hypothetical protein [Acidimicrobiales bacterium]
TGGCDELDPRRCLLPFPNDRFTVADPTTDTGRRVHLDLGSMPRNVAGKPVDPTEWNRNDGFSPTTPILTYVPGLDLHRTWGTEVDHIADLARYRRADAPMVLLDATTGQRHAFWSELDQHPDVTDGSRLLKLHPAVALAEGHRYIVALRRLRTTDGALVPATPQFRAYRDATPMPGGGPDDAEARRPHLERLFAELQSAGVGRHDLFLAWDFTVASERNLTERALEIRDDAFAALGDTDLADRVVEGRAPAYSITAVEDFPDGPTLRRVDGTIRVPNYLTPQVEVLPHGLHDLRATLGDALDQVPDEVVDALDPVTDASPVGLDDVLGHDLSLPGSRFHLDPATGLPAVDPVQPTVDVPFRCEISRTAVYDATRPMLYGHGLLGDRSEVGGASTTQLRERGYSPCAVDWWGMSFADLPNVAITLVDFSGFASMVDRMQQGFLNFLYLGRALVHPDGLAAHEVFRGADGEPLVRAGELAYDGNSQGGIMGGALTALAPDLRRAVLGVPGMTYSTLLNRSIDWEGDYAVVYEAAYPDPIDRQLGFALIQMLWDRGESAGYAHHMTSDPLPGTPSHDVFLQVAFADHQVANVAAEVMGRTIGASLVVPAPLLHWSKDPTFGFRTLQGSVEDAGSVLLYWFSAGTGLTTPPNGNLPPTSGDDPHEAPRRHGPASDQLVEWLVHGRLLDVCGGGPCTIPAPLTR